MILEIFRRFRWKPIVALRTTWEQIALTEQSRLCGILFMKTFYTDVVNSEICFTKEARTSISWLLNEYSLSCKILKNRILFEV